MVVTYSSSISSRPSTIECAGDDMFSSLIEKVCVGSEGVLFDSEWDRSFISLFANSQDDLGPTPLLEDTRVPMFDLSCKSSGADHLREHVRTSQGNPLVAWQVSKGSSFSTAVTLQEHRTIMQLGQPPYGFLASFCDQDTDQHHHYPVRGDTIRSSPPPHMAPSSPSISLNPERRTITDILQIK